MFDPLLAQTTTSTADSTLTQVLTEAGLSPFQLFFDDSQRLDILSHPETLLDTLQQLHVVWAGIFVITGILSVLNGYRWHKWIVIIVAFVAGMGFGHAITQSVESRLVISACMGVLAAVIAWPMMKYAIAVCGGLAGAFVGAHIWTALDYPADMYHSGALLGLVVFGMLAFILYRVVIIAMTCIAGASILTLGIVAGMMHIEPWQESLREDFMANPILLPMLALVAAVVGFVVQQHSQLSKKEEAPKPAAKPAPA